MSENTNKNLSVSPNAAHGAVRVSGLHDERSLDSRSISDEISEDDLPMEPRNASQRTLQVEAHVVPETHDIDVIVNQRLNDELEARLQKVAVAEVVANSEQKHVCCLPRKIFLAVAAAVTVLIAIAIGVSIGVTRSHSSSNATNTSTIAPTARSRQSFIVDALNVELNGNQPWQALGSPQNEAFVWLTKNDTIDVENMTSRQILERYVLGVLYYNIELPKNGSDPLSFFLEPVSVCEWHIKDEAGNLTGITGCTNESFVSEIRLGTHGLGS